MTTTLVILSLGLAMILALTAYYRRHMRDGVGAWARNSATAIFARAEERGAFPKLSVFKEDFLDDYPALRVLEDNFQTVHDECQILLEKRNDIPNIDTLSSYTSSGVHNIGWKTFMFKSGKFIEDNCSQAPKTAALLRKVPDIHTAFFSILEPHQYIKPHWGYWKGFVRYHLGVVVPENNRDKLCWMRVNSQPESQELSRKEDIKDGDIYYWRNGASVMFDDTFLHDAANESGDVRVVLFLDVVRKMPLHLDLLNRLCLTIADVDPSIRGIRVNARMNGAGRRDAASSAAVPPSLPT